MSFYFNLVKYEYRKILKKRSNIIILLIALLLTTFTCVAPLMGNYYVNGEIFESYYDSMKKDREYARNLSGREIDANLLSETRTAYSHIPHTDGIYTDLKEYQEYARPFSDIFYMIRVVYNLDNYEELSSLTKEDFENYYRIRQKVVEENIEKSTMSLPEKQKAVSISREVKLPFTYGYTGGYTRFYSQMYTTAIIICFLCSICVAPIFAGEYTDKMDSLILSSRYGKNKVIWAKICTGLSFSLLLSIVLSAISYFIVMIFFGWDGGDLPIQLFLPLSIRPLTMKQVAWLYFLMILFGNLLSTMITMVLSAKLKTPFMVMAIMTIITIIPMFTRISEGVLWIYHLFHLIPVNMFNRNIITDIYMIDLFSISIQPYQFIIAFVIGATIVLMPFTYKKFKHHDCV